MMVVHAVVLARNLDHVPAFQNHEPASRPVGGTIAKLNQSAEALAHICQVSGEGAKNEIGTVLALIDEGGDISAGVGDRPARGHEIHLCAGIRHGESGLVLQRSTATCNCGTAVTGS